MTGSTTSKRALTAREKLLARSVALVLGVGAFVVALTLVLPHPSGGDTALQIAIGAGMLLAGGACWALAGRIPEFASQAILAATAVAACALILACGVAAGGYASILVWTMLIAGYFLPRRIALLHLGWVLLAYGVTITQVASTAGFSPLTRWLTTAVSLTVVVMLMTEIAQRRERADLRARRFFDLSQDMLSTMDLEGRCVEVNAAWGTWLGYKPEELQGRPLLEITHPGDLERAAAQAREVFGGSVAAGLETRVRAKDGSWHWLRSTATFAPDEQLVYARSTDITELKQVEAQREELLHEVEGLASSDSLTGLPNRRALQERLTYETSRARRAGSPLCLAMLDIDRFKAYNDTHGHLAGDSLLCSCAIAWDSELRGEDTVARFGGEEFVVVLPDTPPEEAAAAIERLRAATPKDQTVSAGLAVWDLSETVDELIGRADAALYEAKEGGRDRLVEARTAW